MNISVLKIVMYLLLLILMFISLLLFLEVGLKTTNKKPILNYCEKGGGEFVEFLNACEDLCYNHRRDKNHWLSGSCGLSITFGCSCGSNKCWNLEKEKCEPI